MGAEIDAKHLDYCTTDHQRKCVKAYIETGGSRTAAAKLGLDDSYMRRLLRIVRTKAAKAGYSPEHDLKTPVPDGFKLKGASTLYDADGNKRLQWIKSSADDERQIELMREAVEAMCDNLPREKPRKPPAKTIASLCNCFILTDFHLGMLSWHEETGADWDIKIAEDLMVDWFAAAIAQSPQADTAVFAQLGDLLHWDGLDAVTPTSKHVLDADTRFQKLVRVAIRAIRRVVGMLLDKHRFVHVVMAEGNHDPASSIWLRELMSALYEDEPRINVDKSPDPYYHFEWGETALFFHHGHRRKPTNVDSVFAAKFRDVFGRTKFAYAHLGHMHHVHAIETPLMIVEQHRTLAAPDAYASRGGWISGRDAVAITYSKDFGEVSRIRVGPKMASAVLR